MPRINFGTTAADHVRRKLRWGGPLWSSLEEIPIEAGDSISFVPEGCRVEDAAMLEDAILSRSEHQEDFRAAESFVLEYLRHQRNSVAIFGTSRTDEQPTMRRCRLRVQSILDVPKVDYGRVVVLQSSFADSATVSEAIEVSESPFVLGMLTTLGDLPLNVLDDCELRLHQLRSLGLRTDGLIVDAFRGEGLLFWIRRETALHEWAFTSLD